MALLTPLSLSLAFSLSSSLVVGPFSLSRAARDAADTRNKHRAKQPGAESPIISHGKLYVNAPLMASFVNGIAVVAERARGTAGNTVRLVRASRIFSLEPRKKFAEIKSAF